jgi:hypothetical protein
VERAAMGAAVSALPVLLVAVSSEQASAEEKASVEDSAVAAEARVSVEE